MWPHSNKNSRRFAAACLALFGAFTPALAQTNATLYLKGGAVLSGEVKTIGPASLSLSLSGTSGRLTQNYADIVRIEWPEPDLWREAVAAFERGSAGEALGLFTQLSKAPAAVSFHPAPGNFAERARRQMLECHRRLRDGAAVTELARRIDWAKLPEEERTLSPLFKVWSLVGASNWPAAKTAADDAARTLKEDDPDVLELSFLQARIAKQLGLADEAIATYAACYTFPSSDASLAADALRESAGLLVSLPERRNELRALAHLYATNIGRGKLWKDAPAEVTALLAEPLHAPAPVVAAAKQGETPPAAAGAEPGAAGGEWVSVGKFRFEPPPEGTPKPPTDPNKKPVGFVAVGGTFKSIEAPAGWASAETRVGQFGTAKSGGTLTRQLKEEANMRLEKGKTLRLTLELNLGKLDSKVAKAVERSSFVRFGLVNEKKAGYGVSISLLPKDKGLAIMADPGGDDEIIGGPGVVKLAAAGSEQQGGAAGGKALPCELALKLQDDGKVLVTARVDQISGSVIVNAVAGQPVVTDFTKSFFVIRLGKSRTTIHFDNVNIEASP